MRRHALPLGPDLHGLGAAAELDHLLGEAKGHAVGAALEAHGRVEGDAALGDEIERLGQIRREGLEVGLLGTPMIMVYRLASWTYAFARLMVRLPDVSLVNLVLGRRAVPELIQGDANPERIAAEAVRLLTDAAARNGMRAALAGLRGRLGETGATGRAAAEVAAMLAEARN